MHGKSRQKSFTSPSQHCIRNLQPQSQLHSTHLNLTSWNTALVVYLIHTKLWRKKGEEGKDERKGEATALQASLRVANSGGKGAKRPAKTRSVAPWTNSAFLSALGQGVQRLLGEHLSALSGFQTSDQFSWEQNLKQLGLTSEVCAC